MTVTKKSVYESARELLAGRRKWSPDADYRWIIGQDVMREIFMSGVSVHEPTPESKRFYEDQPAGWSKYPALLPSEPRYAQFCQLPALVLGNIQGSVALLLRDGVPCGAVHCEGHR
jgi:hypothetical protein